MGKDNKAKIHPKKVKGGKHASEKQDVDESMDSLRDTLIFKLPYLLQGYLNSLDLQQAFGQNDRLLLLAIFFSYLGKMELLFISLGRYFFVVVVFFSRGLFSAFDFFIRFKAKSFHVGIL